MKEFVKINHRITADLILNMSAKQGFKVVVVGESSVGKTAIVTRLVSGVFKEECNTTIGVEFKSYTVQAQGETVKLHIWDTAGQEKFRSVSKAYFRNALGALLVFDISQKDTFTKIETWATDLTTLCVPNAYIILVGNKSDLEDKREVSSEEAKQLAERCNMEYIETSAKDNQNIEDAFTRLGNGILEGVKNKTIVIDSGEKKIEEKEVVPENNCQC